MKAYFDSKKLILTYLIYIGGTSGSESSQVNSVASLRNIFESKIVFTNY